MKQKDSSWQVRAAPRLLTAQYWPNLFRLLSSPKFYLGAPIIIYLLVTLVLPITQLFSLSFLPEGELGLTHYSRLFLSPVYLQVLAITFKTAAYTTLLAVVGGYPVAYLITFAPQSLRVRCCFGSCCHFGQAFSCALLVGWYCLAAMVCSIRCWPSPR